MMEMSTQERSLCEFLKDQPRVHKNRYTETAQNTLIQNLFWSLAGGRQDYLRLFFPGDTLPSPKETWKLRKAQGGEDGDEFTEAARGKACGHIFKSGEATYRCKTCSADETCVLCSRCYDSSDHTGHMVYISVSLGNSGCCDCGDPEAWRLPVHCSIHTAHEEGSQHDKGKGASLPPDLVESIRMTIGRVYDYICDVLSCSPEQLRLAKTKESILQDERMSRLSSDYYGRDIIEDPCEYALMLWNDEKHTVIEVQDMVARACKTTLAEGMQRAHETDDLGRSIVKYGTDLDDMLRTSKKIEEIKVTVTIRSSRDTFREQMCGTIIDWLDDISGCSVGSDHSILRRMVCEEMLKPWSFGSPATNREVGLQGLDDHAKEEDEMDNHRTLLYIARQEELRQAQAAFAEADAADDVMDADDLSDTIDGDDGDFEDNDLEDDDVSLARMLARGPRLLAQQVQESIDGNGDVDMLEPGQSALEEDEAAMAGYPPPPPPPPAPSRVARDRDATPSDSDTAEAQPLISSSIYAKAKLEIPKTPRNTFAPKVTPRPQRYWLGNARAQSTENQLPSHEDLLERVRLDWMILFDLRLWKKVRVALRDLYISTVVTIPEFKRILGLRFSGLYTTLAQLYLIADREPDHSIINISLQMLTTPSITAEIVERGNFLTNLMAILYTFLTTRQVGHPHEVLPDATLAFDSGSVTNRRMYHFFMDLRYLFAADYVQEKLRTEETYMMQFLDLVKLHQGICPNVRAVGEHVEYETDAWISASLITQQINRLCRQFAESFKSVSLEGFGPVSKAIRFAAKTAILTSVGAERKRFNQAEIKEEVKFKKVGDYEFDTTDRANSVLTHSVVKFAVDTQPISFHHALHYTLSWLIECGKNMSSQELITLLSFTHSDLQDRPKSMGITNLPVPSLHAEDYMMALFDYPLRVCAWLAQMKAGIWVRNGMSLRHQHSTYRGVQQRDVSHHRDIFLLQAAMVTCSPARVLVSLIDRYGLEHWMKGIYEQKSDGLEDTQVLDVVEDMLHLLIVLICDRTSLVAAEDVHVQTMRRDITHVLCFKPLSFSDISAKLPEKFQEQEECQDILDEMTTFKAPEGLSDVGTFELREQYLNLLDPYISHYNKNQREESENIYRNWTAKKTGKLAADVVYEAKLAPISSGVFQDLSGFTRTGIFAQIIYYALLYPLNAEKLTPSVPATRVEAFIQVVLHLVLIAISEDKTDEEEMSEESLDSFVYLALTKTARSNFMDKAPYSKTIAAVLEMLSRREEYKSCHAKIALVLKRMKQKRPVNFETAFARLGVPVDRISTASPAGNTALEERERKKKAALERQAKVMAQFQQQQKNFMDNQGDIDWGMDDDSGDDIKFEDDDKAHEEPKTYWQYPSGTCILCQEDTKDGGLYGTFALMMESNILRQTDFADDDFVREVANSPSSLDVSAEHIRPAGVSGENRETVQKVTASGVEIRTERQFIGKGFPKGRSVRPGTISTGCGHIMHYKCFDVYTEASQRRHQHQIARHHPEDLKHNEFVCPLCKALGNAFLPIIWNPKEELSLAKYRSDEKYDEWLTRMIGPEATLRKRIDIKQVGDRSSRIVDVFMEQNSQTLSSTLSSKMSEFLIDAWDTDQLLHTPPPAGFPAVQDIRIPGAPLVQGVWGNENNPPLSANRLSGRQATRSVVSFTRELVLIYTRLNETMRKNRLPTKHNHDPEASMTPGDDLYASDTLAETLGYSISAVEIQQRGVASPKDKTLLETLPQQALTHLRILADTALSYVSIGGIKCAGANRVSNEFKHNYERLFQQLFLRFPYETSDGNDLREFGLTGDTLLGKDIFIFLTECSLSLSPIDDVNIMHIVRLCYVAELVKVVMNVGRVSAGSSYLQWLADSEHGNISTRAFAGFCRLVFTRDSGAGDISPEDIDRSPLAQPCFKSLESVRSFVKKYALTFLRKVVILLNVRHSITFNNNSSTNLDADELDRLTELLHLPTFDEICQSAQEDSDQTHAQISTLVNGWIDHANMGPPQGPAATVVSLSHPVIFELIGLPKNYDTLMEEVMKRRCPTTGKDVSDPALCLFCGEIFCGQAICCLKPDTDRLEGGGRAPSIGGAQQHMQKCVLVFPLFAFWINQTLRCLD